MKKLLLVLLLCPNILNGQTQKTSYDFEESLMPIEWSTTSGTISIDANHYKQGNQSLLWEVDGTSELNVMSNLKSYSGRTTYFQFRSDRVTNDTIVIDFINDLGKTTRSAKVLINFKGWREFNRQYSEYPTIATPKFERVRFTLLPSNESGKRRIWFDDVNFDSPTILKFHGVHSVLDHKDLKSNNELLKLYAHSIDIPLTQPTQQELNELDLFRSRFSYSLNSTADLLSSRTFVNKLNIERNADGTVKGEPMDMSRGALTTDQMNKILETMKRLGSKYIIDPKLKTEDDRKDSILFINLIDHALDQGFGDGINHQISSSDYTASRLIPASMLAIANILSGERRDEMLKLCRWVSFYGTVYFSEDVYLTSINTDLIYNYLPHYYGFASLQEDNAIALREMKALKRYLERHAEISPGTCDGLKIDGSGYHHWTHYNNYMYAFLTWAKYIYHLRGTSFNVDEDGYLGFRNAARSMYLQSSRYVENGTMITANSLAGRNPYGGGIALQIPLPILKDLVEVGGEILNTGKCDPELGALYNYFSNSETFDVPAIDYDGFYQFNYSPTGVARKGNWMVTMRAPTSYFWGAEIYSIRNRFGRYQSHGSMEVTYSGAKEQSGIPTSVNAGGWDWNMVPGTTTVHYQKWTDLNPGQTDDVTPRFDQKAKSTNFSGALSFGNQGIYSTDFVQDDTWGSYRFKPTNLRFKKSVFAFDDVFISLGSDISSERSVQTELTTGTNLFQEIKSNYFSDLLINGSVVSEGSIKELESNVDNTILTPLGTGYIIPKNNDNIVVKYEYQTTPNLTGSDISNPTTKSMAAKAYIDHGTTPSSANYQFVMTPNATQASLTTLVEKINDSNNPLYTINQQDANMHSVTYHDTKTTGYAFFKANSNITFGRVISTTDEHLMMIKESEQGDRLEIAFTNPNLRPVTHSVHGFTPQTTNATITIAGKWSIDTKTDGVLSVNHIGDNTEIRVDLFDGLPEYLTLTNGENTSIDSPMYDDNTWVRIGENVNTLSLFFDKEINSEIELCIYSINGDLLYNEKILSNEWSLNKGTLGKGVFLVRASLKGKSKTFKYINTLH